MPYKSPTSYLPHTPPMVLLDKVIDVNDESACCEVTVSIDGCLGRFLDHQHALPAWYAIELMAQTIGVWSGWHQQQSQQAIAELGLLLGGRSIKSQSPVFPLGSTLVVKVKLQLQDDNIGSFDGEIWIDGQCVVNGRLITYQPKADELESLFQRP